MQLMAFFQAPSSSPPPVLLGYEEKDRIDRPSEPLVYDILVGADMAGGGGAAKV